MTEESKLVKILKTAGKVVGYVFVGIGAAGLIFVPMMAAGCGKTNQNNGTAITNPTNSTNPANPGQVNPSDPGNTGKPIITPPTTDPGEVTPPGEEIVQKTEEALIDEYHQEIEDKFQDSLGHTYIPEDEEFYYYDYDEQTKVVSLNCFGTLGEDLETSAGLKKFLDGWENRNVLELFRFESTGREIQIGNTVYNDLTIGSTEFTLQMGIDPKTEVVSKFGEIDKDGNKYTMPYCAVTKDNTYIGFFSAEINEANPTDEEKYQALMANCESVIEFDVGLLIPEYFKEAKAPTIIETPEVTTLDYSGVEQKMEEWANARSSSSGLNEIISYGTDAEGNFYAVLDTYGRAGSSIRLQKLDGSYSLETQEEIDEFVETFNFDQINEVLKIGKASSDITVDGTTYSKDGIDGDNLLARAAGVENAKLTWFTTPSDPSLTHMSSTHYSGKVTMMCLYGEDDDLKIKSYDFASECDPNATCEEIFELVVNQQGIIDEYLNHEEIVQIGKNLKAAKEVQPSAVAMEK